MATWLFNIGDNSGKRQSLKIKANSKDEAIRKGFDKARKNAAGDLSCRWDCKLISA